MRHSTPLPYNRRIEFQSTHPLRGATRSTSSATARTLYQDFNPRTPCGVRHRRGPHHTGKEKFQSTHPLRGATASVTAGFIGIGNFNPRTPCGVRPHRLKVFACNRRFQSTHPSRGATSYACGFGTNHYISIHAPLAGCDPISAATQAALNEISIHAPLAGCDSSSTIALSRTNISIHAPLAGCDTGMWRTPGIARKFQSTHPSRGATKVL